MVTYSFRFYGIPLRSPTLCILFQEGMTSLHISSDHADAEDIVSALATASCDVNARNKLGRTALHLAAKLGNLQNLKVLLDAGCDRNIKDKLGFTAVGLAFKFNQKGSADILLHYKPRRNQGSSKESVLDENENEPVKRGDPEGKEADMTNCLCAEACSNATTSLKPRRGQMSVQELCNRTFLKLTDSRVTEGKERSRKIYNLIVAMLKQRRDKLDGLTSASSKKTRCIETVLEEKLLNLIFIFTSFIQYPLPVYTVTTLDSRPRKLCLCNLETRISERKDLLNLESDLLLKLLHGLKRSLVCSRNPSKTILKQHQHLPLALTNLKLQEGKESEPTFEELQGFTQMLRQVCKEMTGDSKVHTFRRVDVEGFEEGVTNLNKLLAIRDSWNEKDEFQEMQSDFAVDNVKECLSRLDDMISMKSTAGSFAEDLLEFFVQNSDVFLSCLQYKESTFSAILNKYLSRDSSWMEDKVAKLFLQVCVALANEQQLLLKYAGAIMKQGFSHHSCNAMSLGTCILVRMGLLKGEYDVDTVLDLKGPLLALEHVFTQEYFPRDLAAIFASFLCKSSPKLFGLEELRLRALASAVIKEVLPTSSQEAERDAGKSFKRICDIVAMEEHSELLSKCVDALFSRVFVALDCNMWRIAESLLIYIGLLKSEVSIETVRNLKCGLKLLHHIVNQSYISPELKQVFLCFLQRPNPALYSCCAEIDDILSTLLHSEA